MKYHQHKDARWSSYQYYGHTATHDDDDEDEDEDERGLITELPKDVILHVLSFLQFPELVALRAANHAMQESSHDIMRQRALKIIQRSGSVVRFQKPARRSSTCEIWLEQGHTAPLANSSGAVDYAMNQGQLLSFLNDPKEQKCLSDRLHRRGRIDGSIEERTDLKWSRQVGVQEHMPLSTACAKLGMIFKSLRIQLRSKYNQSINMKRRRSNREHTIKRDRVAKNIRTQKELCFSLLYSSRTIGFSGILCEEQALLSKYELTIATTIFRLDDNIEIAVVQQMEEFRTTCETADWALIASV